MKINNAIFRAYDIRGIYGKDLNEDVAEAIGKAFATYINGGEVVVGYDCRLSSESLRDALVRGLASAGCDVLDIGMVPTPVLYFTIFHYKKDGGIMITGSHNPPEYNGFKLCKGTHTLYGEEIQELKRLIEHGKFSKGHGNVRKINVIQEYIDYVKSKVSIKRPMKIVIDSGNGTAGIVARNLFKELGCEVECLYCDPDGRFPNHIADPTIDATLTDLIDKVKKIEADLGVAYDGDADRVGFVDDRGRIIRGDQALILFSKELLKRIKGAKIIFEVKCSQAVSEEIAASGGVPIMYRTGHSFIKKKMKEENALLAGEMSGHFFFADNYYGYDDAIFASARMLEILSNQEKRLSQLIDELPKYYSTPEIRLKCGENEKFQIVEKVKEAFSKEYDIIDVDGARIQFENGWALIRASNTEPAIILRFEAKNEKALEEIKNKIKNELKRFASLKDKLDSF